MASRRSKQATQPTHEQDGQPSQVGGSRMAGIELSHKRLGAVMESVLALSTQPGGFTSGELAVQVRQRLKCGETSYQPRQAAYDLKKFAGSTWSRRPTKADGMKLTQQDCAPCRLC